MDLQPHSEHITAPCLHISQAGEPQNAYFDMSTAASRQKQTKAVACCASGPTLKSGCAWTLLYRSMSEHVSSCTTFTCSQKKVIV